MTINFGRVCSKMRVNHKRLANFAGLCVWRRASISFMCVCVCVWLGCVSFFTYFINYSEIQRNYTLIVVCNGDVRN